MASGVAVCVHEFVHDTVHEKKRKSNFDDYAQRGSIFY